MPGPETLVGSDSFRVDLRTYDDGLIVALAGEFDLAGIPQFEQAVTRVLDAEPDHILIDFTELQFIDSTGISAIVELMSVRERAGDRLRACGIRGQVERVFELVGVEQRLELVARPPAAPPWPGEA